MVTIVIIAISISKIRKRNQRRNVHSQHSTIHIDIRIKELLECQSDLMKEIQELKCHPILLRLAWSDVQTYDKSILKWEYAGGANGSIRFDYELNQPVNAGLSKAIDILTPTKLKYKNVSWADMIQMAGALAVQLSGGPDLNLVYGRVDITLMEYEHAFARSLTCDQSNRENSITSENMSLNYCMYNEYMSRSPCPVAPFPNNANSPEIHLRNTFYRMGFTNRDIVALLGAHTIGRAFKERSGVCENSSGDQGATIYTRSSSTHNIGMPGGCSWTKSWLTFDNSYYKRVTDVTLGQSNDLFTTPSHAHKSYAEDDEDRKNLLWLPTDQSLYDDPEFQPYFLSYASDQSLFFHDYSIAHKKMSELGVRFLSPSLDDISNPYINSDGSITLPRQEVSDF